MRKDFWMLMAMASLTLLAFLVRLFSASFSSLPYNIDGFPLVKIAENMVETGSWNIGGSGLVLYNSKMPGVSLLLAAVFRLTGVEPMQSIRFVLPMVGSTTVLSGGYLSYKITKNRTAVVGAATFFAFSGFFVYLTSAAMKQVLGMALMPIAFLLFLDRDKKTSAPLLFVLLLSVVLIHHLTFLILVGILGLAVVYSIILSYLKGGLTIKKEIPTTSAILASALFAWWYYTQYSLEHMNYVPGRERILLGMVFVVWVLLGSILLVSPDLEKRPKRAWIKPFLVVSIFVSALALNYYTPIFGVMSTSRLLAMLIVPYIFLTLFPIVGLELLRSTDSPAKPLLFAGFIGPLVFMTFSVASGLDVVSFGLLNRSFNYMDISMGICAGIGLAYLCNNINIKAVKKVLPTIFVCIALLTLPLAYNSMELYGVKDITEDHEFQAITITAEIALEHNLTVHTDQRLGDIISPYYGVRVERNLPYLMQEPDKLPPGLLLISTEWIDNGAQSFPFPNIRMTRQQFDSILDSTETVFRHGPEGKEVYLLSTVSLG